MEETRPLRVVVCADFKTLATERYFQYILDLINARDRSMITSIVRTSIETIKCDKTCTEYEFKVPPVSCNMGSCNAMRSGDKPGTSCSAGDEC